MNNDELPMRLYGTATTFVDNPVCFGEKLFEILGFVMEIGESI